MDKANLPENGSPWDVGMNAVYLLSCALHGAVPAADAVHDLDALFRFCGQHSVTAMAAMALEPLWKNAAPENEAVMTPWKQAKEKAIRKNILLNAERERIARYLDSIGCWYLPLKGSFLQYDYPKFGMRQMSDNDILYDAKFANEICDFMRGSGYTVKSFGKMHDDEYTKAPVYNFEMHRWLFSPLAYPDLAEYYSGIRRLMVKDENNKCGYHLSHEDFYVYLTAHAYKHHVKGGIGIRSLVDVYVFLDKHGASLDWDYLEAELRKLGIWDYECQCRGLAQKLFAEPRREIPLSEEERALLGGFLGAGTYGNTQQVVEKALDRMEQEGASGGFLMKLQYFWRRMFPPLEVMAVLEPDLLQHPWKLSLAYAKRLIKAVFQKPMLVIRETLYLAKSKRAPKE